MKRLFSAVIFSLLTPAMAPAQSLTDIDGTLNFGLSHIDVAAGAVTSLTGNLITTYDLGGRAALQFDRGLHLLTDDRDTRISIPLGAHPHLSFAGDRLAVGVYALAEFSEDDPFWSLGLEVDYRTRWGFGAELALGETRGGDFPTDAYATNKSLVLDYTGDNGWRGLIYFNKDTLNDPAASDLDFYDYGLGADFPLGGDRQAVLELRAGQVRYDALNEDYTQVSVGVRLSLGNAGKTPVFDGRRSILQRLTRY